MPGPTHYDESKNDTPINWIDLGAVSPVKDQGTCKSSWAFSAVGALEGADQIATGTLKSFSEQQLISCNSEWMGCDGGYNSKAIVYWRKNKAQLESEYPYTSGNGDVAACNYNAESPGAVDGATLGSV